MRLQAAARALQLTPGLAFAHDPRLAIVPASDLTRARETDSTGETRARIRTDAVEPISASLRRPVATPEANAIVLEASLSFEVAK